MSVFALVLNNLWQAAAIAAVMWVALQSMPRSNAATRYAIWWAVLLLVLLLPFATLIISRHNTVSGTSVATGSGGAVNPLLPEPAITALVTLRPESSSRWPFLFLAIWMVVFLCSLARTAYSWLYVRKV